MSPLSGEYQREADYAMEMADRAPSDDLRTHWLRLARKWLDMLPHGDKGPRSVFDPPRQNAASHDESSPAPN